MGDWRDASWYAGEQDRREAATARAERAEADNADQRAKLDVARDLLNGARATNQRVRAVLEAARAVVLVAFGDVIPALKTLEAALAALDSTDPEPAPKQPCTCDWPATVPGIPHRPWCGEEIDGEVPELNRLASSGSGRHPTGQMLTQVPRVGPHQDSSVPLGTYPDVSAPGRSGGNLPIYDMDGNMHDPGDADLWLGRSDEEPVIPVVLNPEAVGDPNQTPRVYIGPLRDQP